MVAVMLLPLYQLLRIFAVDSTLDVERNARFVVWLRMQVVCFMPPCRHGILYFPLNWLVKDPTAHKLVSLTLWSTHYFFFIIDKALVIIALQRCYSGFPLRG